MTAALIYNHANVDVINKCHYSVTYVPKLVKKNLIDAIYHRTKSHANISLHD